MKQQPVPMPNATDSEEAVLGSLLIDPESWPSISPILRPSDFFVHQNGWIYAAYTSLAEQRRPFDVVTVSEELERLGHSDKVDLSYIAMLLDVVPSALHVEAYAHQVREAAIRREAIGIASTLAADAFNKAEPIDDILRRAEGALLSIGRTAKRNGTGEMLEGLYEQVMDWASHPLAHGETRHMATGIRPLDDSLGGLQPGLYLIAARPSMGKTAFVLQIASNIVKRGNPVLFFTLEMGEKQLGLRMACSEARVSTDSIVRGIASPEEHYRVVNAIDTFRKLPLSLHYGGSLRPADVRAITHKEMCKRGVSLVIIDGMWLMASSKENENRNLELGAISRELKLMADTFQIPVMAVHQLSRACESRADKRPLLSDLRESGRLEEDCDVAIMLYREGYYDQKAQDANIMEIITRKNRLGGPSGDTARMYWQGQFMRCEPLARNQS